MKEKLDYSNWIPIKMIYISGIAGSIFILLLLLSFNFNGSAVLVVVRVILSILALLCLAVCGYMGHARKLLSYDGGGVQGKVLDNVLSYLHWNGNGNLLDIGCGSGAMTIKAAKKFQDAQIIGVDYWGFGWDYAQSQCENNAKIEQVNNRVNFQKGDAAKLDFPDASFDAAVSNFVFHEVRSQPDKLALIREALRVIKPGGIFSFEDVFFSKSHYKNLDKILVELSKDVSEIHFVDTRKNDFAPRYLNTPFVIGEMGLIYGKK